MQDRPMVTMEHYWEVDPKGPESAMTFDLSWPLGGFPQVTKVKMAHIFSTAAPRPGVPMYKYVHHCPINKTTP